MKKLFIVLLAVLTITSCQKKETSSGLTQQEVSFAALQLDPGAGLKSTDDAPECPTDGQGNLLIPTVAKVVIDEDGLGTGEQTFWPEVFMLDGKMYTQAIKLPVAESGSSTYYVTFFGLYTDTEANGGVLIMATPADGAPYAEYTSPDVDFTFVVNKFAKAEVPVQVLCFMEDEITNFGFDWFQVTELVVREQCFFGDICLNGVPFTPGNFEGAEYGTGLGVDIPAIMQVRVYKGTVEDPYSPWNNESTQGIGAPLCVTYSDNINVDGEIFTFELYVMTKLCDGTFAYVLFDTFTAEDDGPLSVDVGADLVLDYVVGTCSYADADIVYGHFEWLVNRDFFDAPNQWLVTNDPNAGPIYRWNTRGVGGGAVNIAPPIAYFLNKGGYTEQAQLGLASVKGDIDNGKPLSTASIYGLIAGGNVATAAAQWATWVGLYPADGSGGRPRATYWGYDYFQVLLSAKMAFDAGIDDGTYLNAATDRYLDCIAGNVAGFVFNDYQQIFVNAIAAEIGIGTFQGTITWVPYDPNTNTGDHDLQPAAYGLMGGSWASPDVVKTYIKAQVCTGGWDPVYNPEGVSEAEAEAIYALGL